MVALDVRHPQIEIPVDAGAVANPDRKVAVKRAVFDFATAECRIGGIVDDLRWRGRTCATAQLILIDVVVLNTQAPTTADGVARGPVGTERAAARSAGPGTIWLEAQQTNRQHHAGARLQSVTHRILLRPSSRARLQSDQHAKACSRPARLRTVQRISRLRSLKAGRGTFVCAA